MSTTLTVRRHRTDTFELAITLNGAPVNLTGAVLVFAVKLNPADAEPGLIRKTIGDGLTLTDADAGEAELTLTAADKAALDPLVSPYWDILLVRPGLAPETPDGLSGRLVVEDAVAHSPPA